MRRNHLAATVSSNLGSVCRTALFDQQKPRPYASQAPPFAVRIECTFVPPDLADAVADADAVVVAVAVVAV